MEKISKLSPQIFEDVLYKHIESWYYDLLYRGEQDAWMLFIVNMCIKYSEWGRFINQPSPHWVNPEKMNKLRQLYQEKIKSN